MVATRRSASTRILTQPDQSAARALNGKPWAEFLERAQGFNECVVEPADPKPTGMLATVWPGKLLAFFVHDPIRSPHWAILFKPMSGGDMARDPLRGPEVPARGYGEKCGILLWYTPTNKGLYEVGFWRLKDMNAIPVHDEPVTKLMVEVREGKLSKDDLRAVSEHYTIEKTSTAPTK